MLSFNIKPSPFMSESEMEKMKKLCSKRHWKGDLFDFNHSLCQTCSLKSCFPFLPWTQGLASFPAVLRSVILNNLQFWKLLWPFTSVSLRDFSLLQKRGRGSPFILGRAGFLSSLGIYLIWCKCLRNVQVLGKPAAYACMEWTPSHLLPAPSFA